jgi:hypothetical protein
MAAPKDGFYSHGMAPYAWDWRGYPAPPSRKHGLGAVDGKSVLLGLGGTFVLVMALIWLGGKK